MSHMLSAEILAYYQELGERDRLSAHPGSRLEYLRTWDLLTRLLPPAPARVLDVGGATGVYAGPLAAAGYEVHVVDPVPEHVADAAALPGVTAELGDVRDLAAPDASADAVLLLGPLYHLPDRADRLRAWREGLRVVRPGGPVAAATISRFASTFDGLRLNLFSDDRFLSVVDETLGSGLHRPPADSQFFTTAYFHRPDEPAAEAAEAGLADVRSYAIEGAAWLLGRLGDILAEPGSTELLLTLLRRVESEPSLLGATSHMLTAGYRPAPPVG